ncbi:MAG: hypothetical protein SXA11_15940 [Cyanobacteriota bacterium]|nr:hypothetical protein [Cyanobacteriota bacterium]
MNSQEKFSWQKLLQYKFDNFMSRGGFSIFLALLSAFFASFLLLSGVRGFAEKYFPNDYVENPSDLPWEIFVQLIGLRDTGDDANLAARIVGVITILIGLVLFSSLVAFITQEFEARIELLRKGKSLVLEKNHTLILGFNDRIADIISELVVANESEKDAVIVILSQTDKEEMDDFIRNNLGKLKKTRIVTRNGEITNLKNLDKVGVKVAKTIAILNDAQGSDLEEVKNLADARVVKAILAVVAANEEKEKSKNKEKEKENKKERDDNKYKKRLKNKYRYLEKEEDEKKDKKKDKDLQPIVAELHSEQYRRLAKSIAPEAVTTLNEAEILGLILVQTSRNIGLATVYLDLVGFENNEFYFYRPEFGWRGLTFGQLLFRFIKSRPIGVRRYNGIVTIKPNFDYKFAEDDELIVLAEDDSTIEFKPEAVAESKAVIHGDRQVFSGGETEKHLIINWNPKAPIALQEYANNLGEGSEVNLVVENLTPEIKDKFAEISNNFPEIQMNAWQMNVNSYEELKGLKPYEYNSISILAGIGRNSEEIDAKTLTILLEHRQIFTEYSLETGRKVETDLIAEIVNSDDTELVLKAGVKDFLLSNKFVSKILAQVSQAPDVMLIYRELFSTDGCEVHLKPIGLYFPQETLMFQDLTFADCVLAAQKRDEICIGLRIDALSQEQEEGFGIELIPRLDSNFNLTKNDALIVIAEDES